MALLNPQEEVVPGWLMHGTVGVLYHQPGQLTAGTCLQPCEAVSIVGTTASGARVLTGLIGRKP